MSKNVIIAGAGPAGLTAAYRLRQAGASVCVLEKENSVGGISKTIVDKGYRFDVGGHRFFTKVKAVEEMWLEILGEQDFLLRKRLSRIFYNGHFFHYPLRLQEVLRVLGVAESVRLAASYLKRKVFPIRPENSFEDWVTNRFGERLYETFFKTYTEKVWGMPCSEISADWAAQRIKGLSLVSAIKNSLRPKGGYGDRKVLRTLVDSFRYPRHGPGMMWEAAAKRICEMGGRIMLGTKTQRIHWGGRRFVGVEVLEEGESRILEGTHFISSMPIRTLVRQMEPEVPPEVREAAERLRYRDFLTVAAVVRKRDLFADNWIYIHDRRVKVGRIQNYKNWSPEMVPDPETTCLGLEYFCFEGDELWNSSDEDLLERSRRELETLGLARARDIVDGFVLRMPKAYPVYDGVYLDALEVIRNFFGGIENLYLVGRNGMHKYNNQDHSMLAAMLAVENIGGAQHDLWSVNADEEYHEETTRDEELDGELSGMPQASLKRDLSALASTQPAVPTSTATKREIKRSTRS